MQVNDVIKWMLKKLETDKCLYQDDVVDYLVKQNQMDFLKENSRGNLVLKLSINSNFKKHTLDNVVWVKSDRYWRYRVLEDEPGREASG